MQLSVYLCRCRLSSATHIVLIVHCTVLYCTLLLVPLRRVCDCASESLTTRAMQAQSIPACTSRLSPSCYWFYCCSCTINGHLLQSLSTDHRTRSESLAFTKLLRLSAKDLDAISAMHIMAWHCVSLIITLDFVVPRPGKTPETSACLRHQHAQHWGMQLWTF